MLEMLDKKLADEVAGKLMHTFSRSLIEGNYESFRMNYQLPSLVEVSGDARIVSHESEFERLFTSIRRYCDRNEINDVISMVESVEYLSESVVGVTGVICFMHPDGVRSKSPFPVYLMANQSSPDWAISCLILTTIKEPELASAFSLR